MSAVAIMRALLVAHTPLVALVPAARIVAGTVPSGAFPAIGITEIGSNEQDTVARAGNSLVRARVQVTVYASTYPEQKTVLKAAGLGLGAHTGLIAGYAVRSVVRDMVGPDMGDSTIPTFEQSRDFMVTYIEPA